MHSQAVFSFVSTDLLDFGMTCLIHVEASCVYGNKLFLTLKRAVSCTHHLKVSLDHHFSVTAAWMTIVNEEAIHSFFASLCSVNNIHLDLTVVNVSPSCSQVHSTNIGLCESTVHHRSHCDTGSHNSALGSVSI